MNTTIQAAPAAVSRTDNRIAELLRRACFPPLPKVAHVLVQMFANPATSVREVTAVIALDPMLSVRLIKVANSPYFGQRTPVTTVERAGVVLGLNYVKGVSLAMQLTAPLAELSAAGIDMQAFWRDSLLRGCIARQLARLARTVDGEQAFMIGLTQDIGTPVIARYASNYEYADACARLRMFQLELCDWERRELGYTHADVAATILRSWNLPDSITQPIADHHELADDILDRAQRGMAAVAYFVGALPLGADQLPADSTRFKPAFSRVLEYLNLDHERVAEAIRCGRAEFETLLTLFDNLLPTDCAIEQVLSRACQCLAQIEPQLFEAVFG